MGAIPVLRFATLSLVSLAHGSPIWCDTALVAKHLSASCWNMEVMVGKHAWTLSLPVEKCVANPCPVAPQISSIPVKGSAMKETVGHALAHQLFPADVLSEQRSFQCTSLKSEDATFMCDKRCNKKRLCGRHKCNEICCVVSGLSICWCYLIPFIWKSQPSGM